MKRAICLAGGGPAAGLHIGVLEGLKNCGITFDNKDDVWALSCIGAWVGVVYNQAESEKSDGKLNETYNFFRGVFRDDRSFDSFPTNTIFAPDWFGNAEALLDFMLEPRNYRKAFLPTKLLESFAYTMKAINRRVKSGDLFDEGDFNRWTLNHVLAVNPAVRFLTAMIYKSSVDGLAKLYYPDSTFLRKLNFKNLYSEDKPYLFHNAWNLSSQELRLFSNKRGKFDDKGRPYKPITAGSLCACSALPYIEQTVEIEGDIYCEGALVDTVNFKDLLKDHPELDEIWISRIVDADQVRAPNNLHDSLANLCELFAATVGEDDVKLFKYHVMCGEIGEEDSESRDRWKGTIIEIPVNSDINFEWSHSNLERGRTNGAIAAEQAYKLYKGKEKDPNKPLVVGAVSREQRMQQIREQRISAGRARPSRWAG